MFEAPADIYDRYVGRYSRELGRALIATADVLPNYRALDVGCGPGALTGELVALLGADHVFAVDPSQSFVDACRARYPGVRVELPTAEAMPFDDDSVDAAIAQLVVHFILSQNRSDEDVDGVVAGLEADGGRVIAEAVHDAALVKRSERAARPNS